TLITIICVIFSTYLRSTFFCSLYKVHTVYYDISSIKALAVFLIATSVYITFNCNSVPFVEIIPQEFRCFSKGFTRYKVCRWPSLRSCFLSLFPTHATAHCYRHTYI